MGDIADEHRAELRWTEGLSYDGDPRAGPSDSPYFGGLNSYLARSFSRGPNKYQCKFCGGLIGFIARRAYNHSDGNPHTCLMDKRKKQPNKN